MRAIGSPRIALVFDDEAQRKRFVAHTGAGARLYEVSGGDELTRLATAGALDVVIAGVLNRNDQFFALALRELSRRVPEIAMVGVFEPTRPSLDEAADLAREIPTMGFVYRLGPRFEYLVSPGRQSAQPRRAPGY